MLEQYLTHSNPQLRNLVKYFLKQKVSFQQFKILNAEIYFQYRERYYNLSYIEEDRFMLSFCLGKRYYHPLFPVYFKEIIQEIDRMLKENRI